MAQYFSIHPTHPQKRLLRQAAEKGSSLLKDMKKDKNLDPLRERADFQELLNDRALRGELPEP